MYLRAAIYLYFFLSQASVYSQQINFISYTSANGLSQNSGYCMAQDGDGYLWMGTQDGLNRFNGKQLVTFYTESITRGRMPDNFIKAILFDSLNNWLWIGTASGLCIYNLYTDSFYTASHYFSGADTLNGLMIRSIVAGRTAAEIIVVTNSEGVFICNTPRHSYRQFLHGPATKNNTTAATVWNNVIMVVANQTLYRLQENATEILTDPLLQDIRQLYVWQNKLWAASTVNGALYLEDEHQPHFKLFNSGSNDVGCFANDGYNQLWIGTRTAGIVIVKPGNLSIEQRYSDAPNQYQWPTKFTLSLLKDRQGNMWAGSSGGGFAVKTSTKKEFGLYQKKEIQFGKAAHNMILCLYKPEGNLLFAGSQLEGIRIIRIDDGSMQTIYNPQLPGNAVYSMDAASSKDIWLATLAGLYHLNPETKQFTHYADSLVQPAGFGSYVTKLKYHDSLLYSSNRGTVFFDLVKKEFHPLSQSAAAVTPLHIITRKALEGGPEILWLGSNGLGLLQYNIATGDVKVMEAVRQFSQTVNSMYLDKDVLWITTNNGLVLYNTVNSQVTSTYSAANGLTGNVLYSIEKDQEGNFWCGSNAGLLKISGNTRAITQVKASAGLQADEFNAGCSAVDANGNLYFGGINGITTFNPANFSIDKFSPPPLLESIKIANKEISLPTSVRQIRELKLNYQQNFITLEFGVNNFINHEECLYQYQLTGADADWVKAGNRSFVNYANLKPGHYIFKLKSCNSNGIWSYPVTQLNIFITPAWWQTWWFYLLCILSTGIMALAIIRKRISDIRYRAEMKQKITETEMAALKAQMNPHFMFNCINSIDAFIHSNDKYNATLYLNKFAKLLRNILDSSKQNVVLLSKDIDTLKLYLELEELRHEKKFSSVLEVEKELMNSDYKVPPLIIQPFVENAILHGLKNQSGNNGQLFISIKKINNRIQYIIRDNGIGRAAARLIAQNKESSYGMEMSRERIKLFNQETNAAILIEDLFNGEQATGTNIVVYLNVY